MYTDIILTIACTLILVLLAYGVKKLIQINFLISHNQTLSSHNQSHFNEQMHHMRSDMREHFTTGFDRSQQVFQTIHRQLGELEKTNHDIGRLTQDVVSLNQLFKDKRARSAFGEHQLETLIGNILPKTHYSMQAPIGEGKRVDCVIHLPPQCGDLPIDVKFPLENYQNALQSNQDSDWTLFKQDIKKHIDDISQKYVIPPETTEYAVMFLPAESLFIEIMDRFPSTLEYAQSKKVCLSSPTTLLTLIYNSRFLIRDHQTHEQVNELKSSLDELSADFQRFETRLEKFFTHIHRADQEAQSIAISTKKLTHKFKKLKNPESEMESA